MAEDRQIQVTGGGEDDGEPAGQVSRGRSAVCAAVAGVAIGGPLLGMMGLSFLVSSALLLLTLPLLLLFSPLLFFTGVVVAGAAASFSTAIAVGVAGTVTLGWIGREMIERRRISEDGPVERESVDEI